MSAPSCCSRCRHQSKFGNCTMPVEAGLSSSFTLIRHPLDGHGCVAFVASVPVPPPPTALERRAERMHRMGLLDDDDLCALRHGQHTDPIGWAVLLGMVWRS